MRHWSLGSNTFSKKIFLSLAITSNLMTCVSRGEEAVEDDFGSDQGSNFEAAFLDTNVTISNWFYEMADGLDLFLAGERITNKKNETRARLEGSWLTKEFDEPKINANFNVNLRLPNIEEYWNLKFTSYDESKEKRAADKTKLKSSQREKDYGASVGFFQKVGKVRASFQPRVSFTNSLKLSHSLTFESIVIEPLFQVNPKLEFYGNSDIGTGVFIAFNFFYPLTRDWSLTWINDGDYVSRSHLFSTSNGFSLRNAYSETSAWTYGLIFDSNNLPEYHMESYSLSASWSRSIYKNILDCSITPFFEFPKVRNFSKVFGISFAAALNF